MPDHPLPLSTSLSRRVMLQRTGLSLIGLSWGDALIARNASAADSAKAGASPSMPPSPALEPLNRFPRMVHEYMVESEDYAWPLSIFIPGVLKKFDLPDCYRALAAKKLRQLEPWGARAGGMSQRVEAGNER